MGKIFKNQTALQIQLTVGQSITGSTAVVNYKKPSGSTGSWEAVIDDGDDGIISYTISSSEDLDESGGWRFWAGITYPDGTYVPGETAYEFVYDEGTGD